MKKNPIIEIKSVKKSFKKTEVDDLLVLNDLNFSLYEGEVVALLGKSGSGKSTLLRIIAGLIPPTAGEVVYRGKTVDGPAQGVAMVFQSFALLPWLTVLQNVELGLEAQGVSRAKRRARALDAIDVVGLDGFESAFPRELSGGMCQRVGFARALVVEPDVLLMDEPFSALDVLTADKLRSDLLDLWHSEKTNIKSLLFVTHNIEEAIFLADRILVFGAEPGVPPSELRITLPHPRDYEMPPFRKVVDDIYTLMTTAAASGTTGYRAKAIDLGYRLPEVEVAEVNGFLETLIDPAYRGKKVDLPEIADELSLDVDDLFPITEMLEILRFARVSGGDIELNAAGKRMAEANILEQKKIVATHLMNYVPLARHIHNILELRSEHRVSKGRILNELEDYLSESAAEDVFRIVVEWGRYAELFAYDAHTEQLSLENPD